MIDYYLKALLYDYKKAKEKKEDLDKTIKRLVRNYIKRSPRFDFDLNELDLKDVERVSYLVLLMELEMQGRHKREKDIIKNLLKETEKGD